MKSARTLRRATRSRPGPRVQRRGERGDVPHRQDRREGDAVRRQPGSAEPRCVEREGEEERAAEGGRAGRAEQGGGDRIGRVRHGKRGWVVGRTYTLLRFSMPRDLNTVKTSPASDAGAVLRKGDQYHHGALRAALLTAAEAIIGERGIDGFSLREAARRAGVSPAAPQHHFGDARGLLTALATAGFAQLADALAAADAAAGPDREARTRAQATAYVAFALAGPRALRRHVASCAD